MTAEATKTTGFIGLGKMGGAIAARLASQGIPLLVYDTRAAAVAELVARGAQGAADVAAVAARCETVFISLPTPQIVQAVALECGRATGGRVRTVIDLSTTGPLTSEQISRALAERKVELVYAPVSGGIAG